MDSLSFLGGTELKNLGFAAMLSKSVFTLQQKTKQYSVTIKY
jgi:hypothetical protein